MNGGRSPRAAARPELLIFDWDGTLMDSVGSIVSCLQATVEELSLEPIPEDTIRGTIGLGLDDAMEVLSPGSDADHRQILIETYRAHWFGGFNQQAVPFSWADKTLRGLEAEGYLLAIATGKGRQGLERDLERHYLGEHFHATRAGDDSFPKPNPAMVLELLEELGVEARRALVIGDSVHDLEMAKNAATPALAVASGAFRRKDLEAHGPVSCLESVLELPEWLRRRSIATKSI